MPGMASTVSVLCVRPSLCHVCFLEKKTNMCFVFTLYQVLCVLLFKNQTWMF